MKRLVDGKYEEIVLTAEEIAELESMQMEQIPTEPTAEERIAALEEQLAAAKILLGVE